MKYRKIGDSDVEVSTLGMGCAILSGAYGPRDEKKAAKALSVALDLGITFLDSSDAYGNGHNEEFLGKTLDVAQKRDLVIGTKFGNIRGPNGERGGTNGSASYALTACEASLKRLGVEIHARSIFLQGLLLMKMNDIPSYFSPWHSQLLAWNNICADVGASAQHVALDYVISNQYVDHAIVGVESLAQLIDLSLIGCCTDQTSACTLSLQDENILNPSNWKIK